MTELEQAIACLEEARALIREAYTLTAHTGGEFAYHHKSMKDADKSAQVAIHILQQKARKARETTE